MTQSTGGLPQNIPYYRLASTVDCSESTDVSLSGQNEAFIYPMILPWIGTGRSVRYGLLHVDISK